MGYAQDWTARPAVSCLSSTPRSFHLPSIRHSSHWGSDGRCHSLWFCHTFLLPAPLLSQTYTSWQGLPRSTFRDVTPLGGAQPGAQGGWRLPASRPVLSSAGVHPHGPPALHETVRTAPAGDELAEGRRGHRAGQCGQALSCEAASGIPSPSLDLQPRLAGA